jgi:hypothetical protein
MKAKLLIETVVAGETISKEKLTSEEIKILVSKNRIDSKPIQRNACYVNEDEADADRYKKSKDKKHRKVHSRETHELWIAKKFNPRYCNHP